MIIPSPVANRKGLETVEALTQAICLLFDNDGAALTRIHMIVITPGADFIEGEDVNPTLTDIIQLIKTRVIRVGRMRIAGDMHTSGRLILKCDGCAYCDMKDCR